MSEVDQETNGGRHAGREVALQVLYAVDLAADPKALSARLEGEAAEAEASIVPQPPSGPAAMRGLGEGAPAPARTESVEDVLARAAARAAEAARLSTLTSPRSPEGCAAIFDSTTEHFDVPNSAIAFARQLVDGVVGLGEQLDEILGQHARNWRVSRMAVVDRNVLRLAIYELRESDTPIAVVIDEAVDLARRFGSDTSPPFVNGVLDAVAKELRAA
ncbi:MAG: transcription antitermination factor NusB [Myxococcota bacterium]